MRDARAFVWLGGGVFVASLAYCAWWYLFAAGVDRPFAGAAPIAWNAALLALFAVHHSLLARDAIKRRLAPVFGDHLRSVYVWTASLLLVAVCGLWRPVGGTLHDHHGLLAGVDILIQLLGVRLIARSVSTIDPLALAGIRQPPPDDTLQVTGPYRFVRHPLYLGWMVAVFGSPHMTGDRLVFAVLTSLYLVIAIPWEERSMRTAFGDEYAHYAAEVRWRVIPFIY
ncbi:MAG TPA: isoprenylcysteine carboxylmethyltransferase family protein [Vicinamibacterales bacterium]|nr:isoprenylcysteine carboxylmethyltransferase family protein [Vicinamibacterales bacterium]